MLLRCLLALVAMFSAVSARACSIPVFRYALDRWSADPYALEVSVNNAQDEAVGRFLRNFTDSSPLNLTPTRLQTEGASQLVFPHAAPDAPPAWLGALDGPSLAKLTDSPARAEVVRRILDGEVAVWVLVSSGDQGADDQAVAAMEKRLRYLEQVAQLPQIDPSDPTSKLGPGPALRVKFSLLRVARDNPAEQPFLRMLAGPKAGGEVAPGPWFALIFGRGRVLGAWPAAGFGDEQIDEACLFLLGACSCQVKRLNPGWDLLLNADWNESLRAMGFPAVETTTAPAAPAPPVAAQVAEVPPKPETVTVSPAALEPPKSASGKTSPLLVAAGVLLVLGSALAWRTIRRQP